MELTTEIRNRFVSKITVSKRSLATAISDGAKDYVIKEKIHHQVTRLMGMNIVGKDAEQFIDYAFSRSKHGEDIEKFSAWWITNNPDPKFWSFTRMMQLWPQAFKEEKENPQLDFHAKWDKEFVPPPE